MLIGLSFLIVFKKQELTGKNKSKNTDKPIKKTKSREDGKKVEEIDDKFIESGKCFKSICHIEYALFNGFSFSIDVACWGPVAKIYTDNEAIVIRSFQKDDLSIVCFTIIHGSIQQEFFEQDIIDLFDFTITFKFNDDKNSLMSVSKNDNPKLFYDFEKLPEFTNEIKFSNVYETTSGIVPDKIKVKEVTFEEIENELLSCYDEKFINRLSCLPLKFHKNILIKTINKISEKIKNYNGEKEININDKNKNIKEVGKQKNVLVHPGKNKTNKSIDADKNTIKLNGSMLLIDRIYDVQEKFYLSDTLPYVAVVYSVKDVLRMYMKKNLFPFSFVIKRINNLPPPDISITKLFIKYSFDEMIKKEVETETVNFTSSNKIDFNHTKMFTLNHRDAPEIVEAIQTGTLLIKLYGVYKIEANKIPKVYGQGEFDNVQGLRHADRYNKILPPKEIEDIFVRADGNYENDIIATRLLAYAAVDLSQLMRETTWLRLVYNLSAKPFRQRPKYDQSEYTDQDQPFYNLNPLTINEDDSPILEKAYYKESELAQHGTTIKIMVKMDVQLQPTFLSECLQNNDCYSRLIVITKDKKIASTILNQLILINENISGSNDMKLTLISMASFATETGNKKMLLSGSYQVNSESVSTVGGYNGLYSATNIPSSILKSASSTVCTQEDDFPVGLELYLTGFLIDCIDETIIMVEGLTNLSFPRILNNVYRLEPSKSKVLYNSDLLFNKRIYSKFLDRKKISVITMAESLKSILSSNHCYLEGNIPIPAWQVLIKLDLICKSCTINAVCRNNLLPTSKELLSFDLEFGVPLQLK